MIKCRYLVFLVAVSVATFLGSSAVGLPITPVLGDAEAFAVLAGSTVTNAGGLGTTITGDLGVWSSGGANAITGFDTTPGANTIVGNGTTGSVTNGGGIVNGTIYAGGPIPEAAQNSLTTAFTSLNNMPSTQNLAGEILGDGVGGTQPTLGPGVYSFPSTSAQLNGILELDAGGIDGVFWVFQIGTTLTTESASSVVLINAGPNNGSDVGVFWVVGSSATLGSSTQFQGNILADQSITLISTASIDNGRALARIAAVELDNNVISNICLNNLDSQGNPGPGFSGGLGFDDLGNLVAIPLDSNGNGNGTAGYIPEPATFTLLGSAIVGLLTGRKRIWGSRRCGKA